MLCRKSSCEWRRCTLHTHHKIFLPLLLTCLFVVTTSFPRSLSAVMFYMSFPHAWCVLLPRAFSVLILGVCIGLTRSTFPVSPLPSPLPALRPSRSSLLSWYYCWHLMVPFLRCFFFWVTRLCQYGLFPFGFLDVCTPISVQVTLAGLLIVVGNTSTPWGTLFWQESIDTPVSLFLAFVSLFLALMPLLLTSFSLSLAFCLALNFSVSYHSLPLSCLFFVSCILCPDNMLSPLFSQLNLSSFLQILYGTP